MFGKREIHKETAVCRMGENRVVKYVGESLWGDVQRGVGRKCPKVFQKRGVAGKSSNKGEDVSLPRERRYSTGAVSRLHSLRI